MHRWWLQPKTHLQIIEKRLTIFWLWDVTGDGHRQLGVNSGVDTKVWRVAQNDVRRIVVGHRRRQVVVRRNVGRVADGGDVDAVRQNFGAKKLQQNNNNDF